MMPENEQPAEAPIQTPPNTGGTPPIPSVEATPSDQAPTQNVPEPSTDTQHPTEQPVEEPVAPALPPLPTTDPTVTYTTPVQNTTGAPVVKHILVPLPLKKPWYQRLRGRHYSTVAFLLVLLMAGIVTDTPPKTGNKAKPIISISITPTPTILPSLTPTPTKSLFGIPTL